MESKTYRRHDAQTETLYLAPADENFVTDLVPSEIACLANSPGRMSRTEVWISRDEIVDFLE
jgi:hypothetical protein